MAYTSRCKLVETQAGTVNLYWRLSNFGCLAVIDLRLDMVVILLVLFTFCCRQNVPCLLHVHTKIMTLCTTLKLRC